MRPRALVITPDFPPSVGGIQRLPAGLVGELQQLEPRMVTLRHREQAEHDTGQSVRTARVAPTALPHRARVAWLNAAASGSGLLRTDVVLCMHVVCAPAALLLQRTLGRPFVLYLHAD